MKNSIDSRESIKSTESNRSIPSILSRAGIIIAALLVAVSAQATSDSGQSAAFRVDTRAATVVRVTGVTCTYCDGAYGGTGRHAYFLAGVSLPVQFSAHVDWAGKTPARLEFNGANNGLSYVKTLDVGGLGAGGRLAVVAVASDGTRSPAFRANFDVLSPPLEIQASRFSLRDNAAGYRADGVSLSILDGGSDAVPDGVPFVGGKSLRLSVGFLADLELSFDGIALSSEAAWPEGLGFKMAGVTWMPDYGLELRSVYSLQSLGWSSSGKVELGLDVSAPLYEGPLIVPIFGFPTPVGFYEITVDCGFEAAMSVNGWSRFDTPPELDGTLDLAGHLGASANIGFEGLSAGVWAKGGPEIGFQFPDEPHVNKLGFVVRVGYQAEAAGLAWEDEIWHHGWYEIGGEEEDAGLSLRTLSLSPGAPVAATAPHTPSRAYLRTALEQEPPALDSGVCLQANIYPYSRCRLALLSGEPLLAWVRDNPARTAENRTELVWQRRDGDEWSGLQAVWDDGTGDFMPDVDAAGTGRVVAVWQNLSRAMLPDEGLGASLAAAEIAVGVLPAGGSAWSFQSLTTDAWLDRGAAVCGATNGTALVTWVRNPYTNLLGSASQPNKIRYARFDGQRWQLAKTLASDVGAILCSDVVYDGTRGHYVCVIDADGDLATDADQELYGAQYDGAAWSALARLTTNACRDVSARLVRDAEGGTHLFWIQSTNVLHAAGWANLAGAEVVAGPEVAGRMVGFEVTAGHDGSFAVVWQDVWAEAGGAEADPAFLFYDPAAGLWSRRLRLEGATACGEKFLSPVLTPQNSLLAACVASEVSTNMPAPTHVLVLEREIGQDVRVEACAVSFSPAVFGTGDVVEVSVRVDNAGERAATNVQCAVFQGDPQNGGGLIGGTQSVAHAVAAGTGVWVTVQWTVLVGLTNGTLWAMADPGGLIGERCETNNVACFQATGPDLAFETAGGWVDATNSRLIRATIMNGGLVPVAAGTQVTFRRGSADGELLATDTLGALACGTSGVYGAGFRWDMAGVSFTSAFEVVYIAVDPTNAVGELEERNNTAAVQVMTSLDSDGDGLLDGEEQRLGTRTDLADTDGDGLSDTAEARTQGTNPLLKDTDSDGADDSKELAAGTDPNSATDVFKIVAADGSESYAMSVTWSAKAGGVYQVETAASPAGPWSEAPDGAGEFGAGLRTAVSNGLLRYCDTQAGVTNRFYRVRKAGP